MEAFMSHIGISIADLCAGLSGGTVAALIATGSRPTPWGVFSSIIVGALAAAYLGPVAPAYVGAKPSGAASFMIGLGGMPICRAIVAGFRRIKWTPGDATQENK